MGRVAVFLRGMNLGNRRITNNELVACVEKLEGVSEVSAFLASGNLWLTTTLREEKLRSSLEAGLQKGLKYEVPTFVRTEKELRRIVEAEPFSDRNAVGRVGKLQVAFLSKAATAAARKSLSKFDSDDDWLACGKRELYWWPRAGISQSELNLRELALLLGPMTVRTHRTLDRMLQKA